MQLGGWGKRGRYGACWAYPTKPETPPAKADEIGNATQGRPVYEGVVRDYPSLRDLIFELTMAKRSPSSRPGKDAPRRSFSRSLPGLALLICGTIWILGGGCANALTEFDAVRNDTFRERVEYAVKAEEAGDNSRADAAAAQAVAVLGGTSEATVQVARELIRWGRPHPALRLLTVATHDSSLNDNPSIYLMLALAQKKVGNNNAIETTLDEAVRRADALTSATVGKDTTTLMRVSGLLQAGGFWSDADNPRANREKALSTLRTAFQLAPDNPQVQNVYGYTLAELGQTKAEWQQALELTQKATQQDPKNGTFLDSLGWALYKNGDLNQAVYILRRAVDFEEDLPETHCHLGIVYAARLQYPEAFLELNRAIQLWPQYEQAKAALKALPVVSAPSSTPAPIPTPLNAPVSAPMLSNTPTPTRGAGN